MTDTQGQDPAPVADQPLAPAADLQPISSADPGTSVPSVADTPVQPSAIPADTTSTPTPPADLPEQVFVASASADSKPSEPVTNISPESNEPVTEPVPSVPTPPLEVVDPSVSPVLESNISSLSPNPAIPEPPSVPEQTPTYDASSGASQSAEIKPEPLQVVQSTPPADIPIVPEAPKEQQKEETPPQSSFGDMVSSAQKPHPVSSPTPSSAPSLQPVQPSSATPSIQNMPRQPVQEEKPKQSPSGFGELLHGPVSSASIPSLTVGMPSVPKPPIIIPPSAVPSATPETPVSNPLEERQPKPSGVPSISPDILQKQTEEKLKAEGSLRRQHATEARKQKRAEHLTAILTLVSQKQHIQNKDVRDLVHVSQSTASEYLRTLIQSGKLQKSGKAKATLYTKL